jgi:sodium/proline symporter
MAVRDRAAVLRGGVISSLWVLMLFSGAVLLGMTARVYFQNGLQDPETALIALAQDSAVMPGFIGGMIVAAVVAAICSTADSQLLVSASAVSHDVLGRLFGIHLSLRKRMILDRLAVLAVGATALAIAIGEVRSVFSFVLDYGWAGLGAGFGPAIILSLLWRRTTGWGILAGMIIGITTAILWRWQLPALHHQVYNLVPAFLLSLLSIILVSLMLPESSPEVDASSH